MIIIIIRHFNKCAVLTKLGRQKFALANVLITLIAINRTKFSLFILAHGPG